LGQLWVKFEPILDQFCADFISQFLIIIWAYFEANFGTDFEAIFGTNFGLILGLILG
jgi:hypothetical protein